MATTFDRLVAAGAPAITEPHFYRVREGANGQLIAELRELLPYKGSKLIGSRRVRVERGEAVLDALVETLTALVEEAGREEAALSLVGDHFPAAS